MARPVGSFSSFLDAVNDRRTDDDPDDVAVQEVVDQLMELKAKLRPRSKRDEAARDGVEVTEVVIERAD